MNLPLKHNMEDIELRDLRFCIVLVFSGCLVQNFLVVTCWAFPKVWLIRQLMCASDSSQFCFLVHLARTGRCQSIIGQYVYPLSYMAYYQCFLWLHKLPIASLLVFTYDSYCDSRTLFWYKVLVVKYEHSNCQ